jgi:glycosyltransferase involved in cell wall biosynthesis
MPSVTFLIPGDLTTRTGGYEYDRRIVEGLRSRDWNVSVRALDGTFPRPSPRALADTGGVLNALPDGELVVIDGLAFGAMPHQALTHAHRLKLVALVHHPLALETGLEPDAVTDFLESERQALSCVRRVVVTSAETASTLQREYDVGAGRLKVVQPGTDAAPLARGSNGGPLSLVCVASLSPRKGHDVLFRALAALVNRSWELMCVGDDRRDAPTADRLRSLLEELKIADRVSVWGEAGAAETAAFYDAADVFVLATLYEGYGMAVAEALARGLPVLSTPTGAIPDLVGGDAGLLVAAGDVEGWIRALARVFDPGIRAGLTAGARARRLLLPDWDHASGEMAEVLQQV